MSITTVYQNSTVIESLARSLESAARYNPNDVVKPNVVLWTDSDAQWQPIIPQLRTLLPQLLTFGEYQPENRTGPAIWLRSVIDRALPDVELDDESTPIIYLPKVSRQKLRAVQECPDALKPLVELQFRGVSWTQINGKDWTLKAFLVSQDGGLGLDVSNDATTRQAMLGALKELATTSMESLRGKHLEAEDFDKLFTQDPDKDVLHWLSDSEVVRSSWDIGRWNAFKSHCKKVLLFDPDTDGALVGAENLGKKGDAWRSVWDRFTEAPALYKGVTDLLRQAKPNELFDEPSSWPQVNEKSESKLCNSLLELENLTPAKAREQIIELEKEHGPRRNWVWARLGQAPLALALSHLSALVEDTATNLGGTSTEEMAKLYIDGAWKVDAAALFAMASVKSTTDVQAVSNALNAIYQPWLEAAAVHLQFLAEKEPLPGHDGEGLEDIQVEPGGLILFADGLRFDVSRQLTEGMSKKGRIVTLATRWAGLPTVTATAKSAVSPISRNVKGLAPGEDFQPVTVDGEQPLTTVRFRKLLSLEGYQYLSASDTGDPSGRGWTEDGEFDKLGHSLQGKLASRVEEQVDLLIERLESLFDAGWHEIRVVTDHGWLWLPSGLPRVDLPKFLTKTRWSRCAAIDGESSVSVPTVRWHWNAQERVAIAPGISCFNAGNKYAHGGLSLQESLIPVIRITAGNAVAVTTASITDVSWAGLRCRVRVSAVQSGLSVDLREKVNDPESSVSKKRQLDDKGAASLLVANDEFEGKQAAVVILDADGQVITRQSTIIGGID